MQAHDSGPAAGATPDVGADDEDAPRTAGARLAAVDLGSNSFHMVVARVIGGHPQIFDRHREPVRLAEGLLKDGGLDPAVEARALAALARFGERLGHMNPSDVRVVGTNTLRLAREQDGFLAAAEAALGQPVYVVSGQEEARLIHLGVMHTTHPPGRDCLVLDIGGGSTEVILGTPEAMLSAHSIGLGCVGHTQRYFADGTITRKAYRRARKAALLKLEPHKRQYRGRWDHCLGSSGTLRAVAAFAQRQDLGLGTIRREALKPMRDEILAAAGPAGLVARGVSENRARVFAAGFAIVHALFDALDLDEVHPAQGALREGVLYDLLGRLKHEDVRDQTVRSLQAQYHVDAAHAERVGRTAAHLYEQVYASWGLSGPSELRLLTWACQVHEVGLAIAHAGHQRHAAYLVRHSHLPGFAREEQALLAALVGRQRGPLVPEAAAPLAPRHETLVRRLTVLLRLATALRRSRDPRQDPAPVLRMEGDALELEMPAAWWRAHPLTRQLLEKEARKFRTFVTLRLA